MNKYSVKVFFLIIIFLFTSITIHAKEGMPLKGKTIIVDAGHGGKDPGTIYKNIYEKDINLSIALKLKNELLKKGAKVIMTRDGDYDLSSPNAMHRKRSDFDNRIKLINNSHADLYISIHLNYLEQKKYYGPQVFYYKEDLKLASTMQKVLNKYSKSNREIKFMPDVYMYKRLNISGLLIECGFLSNGSDREKLLNNDYQLGLTKEIVKVLMMYFT